MWYQTLLIVGMLSGCRGFGGARRRFVAHRIVLAPITTTRHQQQQQQRCLALWSNIPQRNGDGKSTWEYKPYVPPPPGRRRFTTKKDNWIVPKKITIPEDQLEITFARSSGAGGQNVNKVNTKVDIRFRLMEATWIPLEVRERMKQQFGNRVNKDGYFNLDAQDHRTQIQNRKSALAKLEDLVIQAYPRPKERKLRKGVSRAAKERNKQDKKKRGETKANRKSVDY